MSTSERGEVEKSQEGPQKGIGDQEEARSPQTAPLLRRLWCLGPGSNRRHADFQSAPLPTELPRQIGDAYGT